MTSSLVIKYIPSLDEPPLLRRYDKDQFVLNTLGAEISTKLPHVWNRVGPVWKNAMLVMTSRDSEESAEDESDSTDGEDQSYKPVYRVRNLVKWLVVWLENDNVAEALDATADPQDILEQPRRVKPTNAQQQEPSTISGVGFSDLPPELVVYIAQLALEDDPHIATTLSHLNSAFRICTLSTPSLWTVIDIKFPEKQIAAHLERSGSAFLRVRASLILLTKLKFLGMGKLDNFVKMIRPHSARISSLEMLYTSYMWARYALTTSLPQMGALPNLDQFEYGVLLHQPFGYYRLADLPATCRPRRIRLEGLRINTFRDLFSEKVVSLKVTECWEGGLGDWQEALQSMKSLQILEILDFKMEDPGLGKVARFGTKISPISLPYLQTLSLTRVPRAVLISLLQALQTPNLISATIAFLEPDGLRDYNLGAPKLKPQPTHGLSDTVLLPFVAANSQLQELDLHNCCMTPDMWTAVFAPLHNLSKLRIASSDVTTKALKSLVASSGALPALPSLTHLTLDNESLDEDSSLSFYTIDEVITTRWALCQQQAEGRAGLVQFQALKSVILRGWNESHLPTTTELARLSGLVEHLHLEVFRETSDDGEATDGEWETLSEGSWASGDQAVVDRGNRLLRHQLRMWLEGTIGDGDGMNSFDDWEWDDDKKSPSPEIRASNHLRENLRDFYKGFPRHRSSPFNLDPSRNHDPPLDFYTARIHDLLSPKAVLLTMILMFITTIL
ncbi:hypothetical protein FRC00_005433 [Tulasnella sp. 408]|nr:hypothetical protein FRC00_005433 [Tulasnella sp. 408]